MVSIHLEKTYHILRNLQLHIVIDIHPFKSFRFHLIHPWPVTTDGMACSRRAQSFLKYLGIGVLPIHHFPITKPFAVFLLLGVKGTMVSLDAFHPSRQAFAQMPLAPHKGLVKTLRTTFTSVIFRVESAT